MEYFEELDYLEELEEQDELEEPTDEPYYYERRYTYVYRDFSDYREMDNEKTTLLELVKEIINKNYEVGTIDIYEYKKGKSLSGVFSWEDWEKAAEFRTSRELDHIDELIEWGNSADNKYRSVYKWEVVDKDEYNYHYEDMGYTVDKDVLMLLIDYSEYGMCPAEELWEQVKEDDLTEDILLKTCYSASKIAKIYRDNEDTDYNVYRKREMYAIKHTILANYRPTAIHKDLKYDRLYLYYDLGGDKFHSPVREEIVEDFYDNLPITELEVLEVPQGNEKELYCENFCRLVAEMLETRAYRQSKNEQEERAAKFKTTNFDEWQHFCMKYIKDYIENAPVYQWLPAEEGNYDHSGSTKEVPKSKLIEYIDELEQVTESFLDELYTGNSTPTYESGWGLNYRTFAEELAEDLERELFDKLYNKNNLSDDSDDADKDNLVDFISDLKAEWVDQFIESFTKDVVLEIYQEQRRETWDTCYERGEEVGEYEGNTIFFAGSNNNNLIYVDNEGTIYNDAYEPAEDSDGDILKIDVHDLIDEGFIEGTISIAEYERRCDTVLKRLQNL